MNFYRRNYIEGLFLSSGIFKDADYTMERLLRIVKKLRTEHKFNGYIHLKTIPGASEELLQEAGLYADRMSINLEIPTEKGLKLVAPEKDHDSVRKPLAFIQNHISNLKSESTLIKHKPLFVPAGQSTQMVVGATPETDLEILSISNDFYKNYHLKRVYYSGYIPIQNDNSLLPKIGTKPPLVRENRLYQADWLMRFYGFDVDEIVDAANPQLDMVIDPKLSWALRNPFYFPVDINKADFSSIIRVPGIGRQSARKIVQARKFGKLHTYQIQQMGIAYNRAKHFIVCVDSPLVLGAISMEMVRRQILQESNASKKYFTSPQLSLFS